MALRRARRFLAFSFVGAAGFVVDYAALSLLNLAGLDLLTGQALAWLCAATFTWYLNRRITFASQSKNWGREWGAFVLANALGGAVNFAVYALAINLWPLAHEQPVLAVALGSLAGLVVNFAGSSRVFAAQQPPADPQ